MDRALAFVQAGGTLSEIRELLVMQREHEDREAEKAFNRAFAAFKAEAQSILKSKHVDFPTRVGRTTYDHAELFDVVETLTPSLSRHGLSTSWSIPEQHRDWIVIQCRLKHELGFSESVRMGGPPDESGGKNAIQAISSATTYLERQTMKAVCGVAEKGADNDGRDPSNKDPGKTDPSGPPFDTDDRRDVLRERRPTTYDHAMFTANLVQWKTVISEGRKTPDALIEFIEKRNLPLTAEQKQTLRAVRAA